MSAQPTGSAPSQPDRTLATVVRSSHDAVIAVNLDLEIIVWNPAAEALLGYTEAEIVGRDLDVLIPDERRADQREIMSLVAAGAQLDRFRTRRMHRDGHPVEVSLTVSPLVDDGGRVTGLSTITRRLSERERHEAGVQAILEVAPDAIVGVDPDGRVVLSNTQAERLFGLARHGLIGKSILKLVSPDLPTATSTDAATGTDAAGSEPDGHAALAHRSDGSTIPVEITVSVLHADNGPVRCAVIRDISERLRAQEEYLRMQTEAERARVEAQLHRTRRLESLGQLAGGIAHDFNNLIGVIVNYASLITEDAAAAGLADLARDAEQITRAGGRAAELTHQLLAFARREVVRPRALDLNDIIRDVEQMLRRSIGEHITLTTSLADRLPAVTADPGQLEQILVNLAVNARDAMPRGGTLRIGTRFVEVDAGYTDLRPGGYVRLQVGDTGTGMPRDVIDRAFEPFFTTKPPGQGTGLGLATVYGIVTAAGGDLSIHSEPGLGTTVNILLPTTDERPATTDDPRQPRNTRAGGETILLVEDEPALREVSHRILTTAGYKILGAPDGPTAITVADDHDGPIHLLLTDVVMPHMLGKELAERITTARPGTRVLYMSGYAQPVLASQGTLDPEVTLLEKPFTKAHLLAAVRDRLDKPDQ